MTWSKTDASENDIIDSLKLANAYDFVMKLPKKLETVVGERGTELSGGEKDKELFWQELFYEIQLF